MADKVVERRAGQFAQERFEQRRRAWLRRVWWALPLVGLFVAAGPVLVAALFAPDKLTFFIGLGIGSAIGMLMTLVMSPPPHIERWRLGAEGERATARALRPLTKKGWTWVHDIQTQRGNIDHVLIGPPGVFVLETKNLGGLVSVVDDKVIVRWREAPDDGYVLGRVGVHARGRAATLHDRFRAAGVHPAGCKRSWCSGPVRTGCGRARPDDLGPRVQARRAAEQTSGPPQRRADCKRGGLPAQQPRLTGRGVPLRGTCRSTVSA